MPPNMASSQVEFRSSSSFGCVLRDHNHNRQEPPSSIHNNPPSSFPQNLKVLLVRDRVPSDETSLPPAAPPRSRILPHKQGLLHRRRNRSHWEEKSKGMTGRESGMADQWVARQAEEMASTAHEVQILSPSSESSDCPDTPSLGASSLVQIWEERLSRSNSKTNLGFNYVEIDEEASSRPPEVVCAPAGERSNNGGSSPDWDSDRTPPSGPPSSQGQDSDGGETERVSVAAIIQRLTSGKLGAKSQNSTTSSVDDNDQEQPVTPSPRLRGKRAYIKLLMQITQERRMELDRLADSQPVSRFPHRGRLQSMLRLRFLNQGVAANDQVQPSLSRGSELGRPQGSAITCLRERFSTGVEYGGVKDQTCVSNSRSPPSNTLVLESSPTSHQISEGFHHQKVNTSESQTTSLAEQSMPYATEYVHEDIGPISNAWQGPSFDIGSLDSHEQETADRMTTLNNWNENITAEEEVRDLDLLGSRYDWFSEISRPRRYWEDLRQTWYREMLDSDKDEIRQLLQRRRVSTSLASNFRERMDKLMKSRLQKQLHPEGSKMPQEGIEREAELEEEMGGREISLVYQGSNTSDYFNQERSFLWLPSPSSFRPWDHFRDQECRDDSDQAPSSSSQLHPSLFPFTSPSASQPYNQGSPQSPSTVISCHSISCNTSDHPYQGASPLQFPSSLFRVWGHCQAQEVRDDPDQVAPASLQQYPPLSPSASQSNKQGSPQSSSTTSHPSIEMDLIYDLRGQMEHLHHEMAELRKSIRGCMSMQVKLQQLMKQKVSAASHSVGRQGNKKSLNSAPRNGNCCICYEMEIDSLLYRCGHMCTCLKCAYELQSSTGRCPICRASIVDVVRAYAHS